MAATTEAVFQQAVERYQLRLAGQNREQHRTYKDGQDSACPHNKFTDSQLHHTVWLRYIAQIRDTRDRVDRCKESGPCSKHQDKPDKTPPSTKRDKFIDRQAKRGKQRKAKTPL